jgi:hypothetical protein
MSRTKKFLKQTFNLLIAASSALYLFNPLVANAQLTDTSNPFDVGLLCEQSRPCAVYPQELSFTPAPQQRAIFGDADLTLKINGTDAGAGKYIPELGDNGSFCYFQIKAFDKADTDTSYGYDKLTTTVLKTTAGATPEIVDYDSDGVAGTPTQKAVKVAYNKATGCGVIFPKQSQDRNTIGIQYKVNIVNTLDNTYYLSLPAYFMKFGAFANVDITY